ncbi:secretin receptor-like [Periplaneta americana]|uniref:secretin receptor-like n=1 Tax=Periplaneta americana TaxID=6978 RepID=UPI0037E989CC
MRKVLTIASPTSSASKIENTRFIMSQDAPQVISPEDQYIWLKLKEDECFSGQSSNASTPGYCPRLWDGIMCWSSTAPGQLAEQSCANYIIGFDQQANASKLCTSAGEWFRLEGNNTWTNYTRCVSDQPITVPVNFTDFDNNPLLVEYIPVVKTIAQIGYAVSLSTLVIAFCIIASIKKLRCPRNMLHLHLFVSFILRAFTSLLKDIIFVSGVGLRQDVIEKNGSAYFYDQNNWLCKTFTSAWQYTIMANYSWILMEGLYLHNLIFLALFSDTSSITLYVALGWGLPAVFVVPWVLARAFLDDTLCWTTKTRHLLFLLIRVPITVSILLNFALFVNIVRVLLLKLRASVCDETRTYRRWAKSTLVLVPLFGVHYTLFLGMSYSMGVHPGVELVWLFCDQLFASFQGFFVAVLYCFLNGEVRAELKKHWPRSGSLRCFAGLRGGAGRGGFFCRPMRPTRCYSNTSCTSLSMGAGGAGGCLSRKMRQDKRLSTSFNTECRYSCAPNASEANAALGFDSRWYHTECTMQGCNMEMGPVNVH